jgi:hypothetical protein
MRRALVGLSLLAVCLGGSKGDARADQESLNLAGATPTFALEFGPISLRTGNGGPSTAIFWNFTRLGETGSVLVWSGGPGFQTLCAPGSGLKPPEQALVLWRAQATLLSYDATGATLDLLWTRTVEDPAIVDGGSIERHLSLHLVEGNREVLDLVRMAPGADGACDGAAITARFMLQDPKALAQSLLEYDVWLVDRDRAGHETVDHVTTRGLQGRSIDYAFEPIRYAPDGTVSPAGSVQIDLQGQVKGRVRPDGRIDLVVGASRMRTEGGLGSGDGGGKQATVSDGETVEFQLPVMQAAPTPSIRPTSLQGELTAIRVTARRVS